MTRILARNYYDRGLNKLRENKLHEAKKSLQKSVELDNQLVEGHNVLGLYYYHMGDMQEAKKSWTYSLGIEENDNRARKYLQQLQGNQIRAYEDYCDRAIKAMRVGKYKQAEKFLRTPEVSNIYAVKDMNLLGLSLYGQKKKKQAFKVWQEVLTVDPQNEKALKYIVEGEWLDLRNYIQKILGLKSGRE